MADGKLFRINELELKSLEKKTREINAKLIDANLNALKDTELLHKILKRAIDSITLDKDMRVIIKPAEEN
jgi:hypothetical protein